MVPSWAGAVALDASSVSGNINAEEIPVDAQLIASTVTAKAINEVTILLGLGKFYWPAKGSSYVVVMGEAAGNKQEIDSEHVLQPLTADKITDDALSK